MSDDRAQLTKLTDWLDGVNGLRYSYDDAGRISTITDYDNSVLGYDYDGVGNVTMESCLNKLIDQRPQVRILSRLTKASN